MSERLLLSDRGVGLEIASPEGCDVLPGWLGSVSIPLPEHGMPESLGTGPLVRPWLGKGIGAAPRGNSALLYGLVGKPLKHIAPYPADIASMVVEQTNLFLPHSHHQLALTAADARSFIVEMEPDDALEPIPG